MPAQMTEATLLLFFYCPSLFGGRTEHHHFLLSDVKNVPQRLLGMSLLAVFNLAPALSLFKVTCGGSHLFL